MAVEDSPPLPAVPSPPRPPPEVGAGGRRADKNGRRLEVYNEVLATFRDLGGAAPVEISPAFEDALWAHFHRLPARYALDVNAERAEDVVTHLRLLEEARGPDRRPALSVRVVQVSRTLDCDVDDSSNLGMEPVDSNHLARQMVHPPPAFSSCSNLEALALQEGETDIRSSNNDVDGSVHLISRPMHEITFATADKPKLLSQLTCLLAELGLDIQEAHAFSTIDGYSLDVFVVTGWHLGGNEQLKEKLLEKFHDVEAWSVSNSSSRSLEFLLGGECMPSTSVEIPTDGTDVWEIDVKLLKFGNKVASGSNGDLYRGSYCSQDVAIKVVRPERISADMYRDFAQEVYIMRPNHPISQIPYEYLTPLQAAIGVVQKGIRPTIPKDAHPKLAELLQNCWHADPAERPDFSQILEILQRLPKEVASSAPS
ncbi:hypothetical protein ABZP36_021801 [Zizania latifolia]